MPLPEEYDFDAELQLPPITVACQYRRLAGKAESQTGAIAQGQAQGFGGGPKAGRDVGLAGVVLNKANRQAGDFSDGVIQRFAVFHCAGW